MVQSFKTLNTICNRAGLEHFRIIPHQTCFPEQEVSSTGVRRMALMAFTKGLNIAAARRPLLAGGWIIDTVLA
jgi:hypothetical protein